MNTPCKNTKQRFLHSPEFAQEVIRVDIDLLFLLYIDYNKKEPDKFT